MTSLWASVRSGATLPTSTLTRSAVVSSIDGAAIVARAGALTVTIDRKGYAWTNKKLAQLVNAGDLVEARLTTIEAETGKATGSLEQPPAVEGAILALGEDCPHPQRPPGLMADDDPANCR